MTMITQLLKLNKKENVSKPLSTKSTPELERVDLVDLENRYKDDPIIYNSINVTVQTIMAPGSTIIGDKEDVSTVEIFFDSVGSLGGEIDWYTMISRIFQHQCIYGRAWIELIPNEEGTKLVDLDIIDPKKMDYLRDPMGNIALDDYGNPIGYVEQLPMNISVESKLQPPAPYSISTNQIFFPPERIAHFKFNTVGDGFEGIGLIEPIYRASVRRENAETAWANSPLFPILYSKVGDDQHEPTEQHVTSSMNELAESKKRYVFSYPHWVEVGVLQANSPEKIVEQFKYFEDEIIAGVGVAKAFAKWEGGETNRDTLARQEYMFKLALKNIIDKTTKIIEKRIFGTMRSNGQINSIPRIVWNEIALQELDSKAERIVAYIDSGTLTADRGLEDYIRKMERLPAVSGDPSYEK